MFVKCVLLCRSELRTERPWICGRWDVFWASWAMDSLYFRERVRSTSSSPSRRCWGRCRLSRWSCSTATPASLVSGWELGFSSSRLFSPSWKRDRFRNRHQLSPSFWMRKLIIKKKGLNIKHCAFPFLSLNVFFVLYQMLQFPTVSHPQTLERRYLGIINGLMLDLMKVRRTPFIYRTDFGKVFTMQTTIFMCIYHWWTTRGRATHIQWDTPFCIVSLCYIPYRALKKKVCMTFYLIYKLTPHQPSFCIRP